MKLRCSLTVVQFIIEIFISQFSEKLQSIVLSVHNGVDCGGSSVYIEIVRNGAVTCKTKVSDVFHAGTTIKWEGSELGSCKEKKFDQHHESISYLTKTSHSDFFQSDDFCPKNLIVQMDSNRTFESDVTMTEWVDKNKNSEIIRTATLMKHLV